MGLPDRAVQGRAGPALALAHRLTRDQGRVIEDSRRRIGGMEARVPVRERLRFPVRLMRPRQVRVARPLVEFHVLDEASSMGVLTEGAPIVVLFGGGLALGGGRAATSVHDLAVGRNRKFGHAGCLVLRGLVQGLPVVQAVDQLRVIHELLLHRKACRVVHRAVRVAQAVP